MKTAQPPFACLLLLSTAAVVAQVAPTIPLTPARDDETVHLSPFEVQASTDVGYQATETLAGSRMRSNLKDIPTQLEIMTPEFIQDLGITNLEDALRYSLNGETSSEIIGIENPNLTAQRDTISYSNSPGRTRNLGAANTTHDFFDTVVRIDAYNTERFTFASGPNSILFGNSGPAGTIDTSFKRASTNRPHYSFSLRTDNYGSLRTVTDLNQPFLKDRLGVRFVNLRDRQKEWKEPAYDNQDRYFASVVFTPFKKLSVRGYFERTFDRLQASINTLMQDHVTPWLKAGKPLFDNGGTTFPAFTAANNPGNIFIRNTATSRRYIYTGSNLFVPGNSVSNTVDPQGYDGLLAAPNNFEHSILDQKIFPFDVSGAGNGNGSKVQAWIRGAIVEFNPVKNLFFELGVNQEQLHERGANLFRGTDLNYLVDVNQYIDNGGTVLRNTPNPNVGRYYFQANTDGNAEARKNYFQRDQRRLSAAYDLDFTVQPSWTKWLGRHRIAGLYEELTSTRLAQNSDFRIISDNAFIPAANGTALDNLNPVVREPIFRYYLAPGEDPWPKLPFDILASGVQTLPGTDSAGNPVLMAGFDSPVGAPSATTGGRNRQASTSFAVQSSFLKGKVAVTYGRRRDNVKLYVPDTTLTERHVAPSSTSGYVLMDQILASPSGMRWTKVKSASPITSVKGVVVHPFSWVSLSYSKADSQQVSTSVPQTLDGSFAVSGAGEGRDYGITLRLPNDRLSLRYLRYETSSVGSRSPSFVNNSLPTVPGASQLGINIRSDFSIIERSIMWASDLAGTPYPYSSNGFRWFQDRVRTLAVGQNSTAIFGQGNNDLAFNSDRVAKGDELTVVGNPTSRWRLSVSVAKSRSTESNIGPEWFQYFNERKDIWARYLDVPIHTVPTRPLRELLDAEVKNLLFIQNAAGKPNARERKYRATAVTRYSFEEGRLKGMDIGGSYIWRSPAIVGYPQITTTNRDFAIPGITPTVTVDDQDHPYKGGGLTTCDVFMGYGRRILGNKVHWRVQLNIRNALNRDDPQVQKVLTTGEGAIYTAPEPRSFILTNSFDF